MNSFKKKMKRIVFFGDSLTAGYGLSNPSLESFPALLAERAKAEGFEFNYMNAGVSGDTTQSALLRLPKVLTDYIDIFVIGIGANDILRAYDPKKMAANIESIIQKIRLANHCSKIILLGMELPKWIAHQSLRGYQNIYTDLAYKFDLVFLPFMLEEVIGNKNLNMSDLVHPNKEGYKIISARIWPLLKSTLEE